MNNQKFWFKENSIKNIVLNQLSEGIIINNAWTLDLLSKGWHPNHSDLLNAYNDILSVYKSKSAISWKEFNVMIEAKIVDWKLVWKDVSKEKSIWINTTTTEMPISFVKNKTKWRFSRIIWMIIWTNR